MRLASDSTLAEHGGGHGLQLGLLPNLVGLARLRFRCNHLDFVGMNAAKEYRLYEFTRGGSDVHRVDLFFATEEEAIQRAKSRVRKDPIELWEDNHCVARFVPENSD
jgi:hypothetical protein